PSTALSHRKPFITALLWCSCIAKAYSQTDSLVLKNNDVMVGEIKSMTNGVLTIETPYSKKDFTVEWSGIRSVYSKTSFLISLQDGQIINGSVWSGGGDTIFITSLAGQKMETSMDAIVYLKGIKSRFWGRTYATIDLGVNITKANNLREFSARTTFGYMGNKWQADIYYNDLRSKQDSVDQTKRTEGGLSVKYFLQKSWFLAGSVDFLSNTEQALNLRTTGKLGAGHFIFRTNKMYWALGGGLSFNNESFTNEKGSRNSLEAFASSGLNLFDIGDLSLNNTVTAYPSLTESGRWRIDFLLDTKYDLPLDLYLKLSLNFNYDNQPAIAGNEIDYVMVFSVGWEFNK
ncbi:MAG TPA: DUF481 domain-containing protein, partial [Chitinophagaceae bacterium]|nr:DUF481 domain-containing protein [Chitinophagaceae bacterium]